MERKYKKSGLAVHREMFDDQANSVVELVKQKKSEYYKKRLSEADKKDTFRIVKTLLEPPKQKRVQDEHGDATQAENFRAFFEDKVKTIQRALEGTQGNPEGSSTNEERS